MLRTDVRYALRQLARAPVLTIVVSASIAVGIAVAAGAFSFLNGVLFKPLPVPDADGVYHVYTSDFDGRHDRYGSSSYRDYVDFAASNAFGDMAVVRRPHAVAVSVGSAPPADEYVAFASTNFFDVLRLPLRLGRGFSGDAREPVIVLSYPYWQRRFDGAASALGQTLRVNGVVLTVVGVAPERFRGTSMGPPNTGWAPVGLFPAIAGDADALESRRNRWFDVVGRLAPAHSADAAEARLNGVARALAAEDPAAWLDIHKEQRLVSVLTHRESLAPPGQRGELVLGVAVASVLRAAARIGVHERREPAGRARDHAPPRDRRTPRAGRESSAAGAAALYAAVGAVVGLALGVPASLAVKNAVPGVRATDLLPYAVAMATVACAAALAAFVPALRAARVQPAVALRVD